METEIKFKQRFEKKLIKLGVREQFISNLKNLRRSDDLFDFDDIVIFVNSQSSFWFFISTSFDWSVTPEGYKFWENIANS